MFPLTKPQQYVSAASLASNIDTETANTIRCLAELNSDATMKVCRVCLATSVKMYHMSNHKLDDMYKRVTGVEIKLEDRLPKMLCWECVARLSSANSYVEKALKTHWMLMKKLNSNKFITFNDIESIDRAQYQLDSTLGVKYCKEENSNLFRIKEGETEIDNDIVENCDIYVEIKTEFYEPSDLDQSNQEQQIFITENVTNEKDPIRNECLDEECEKQKIANVKFKTQVICKQENISDEEVEDISNVREMSEEQDHMVDYSNSQKRKQSLQLLRIPQIKALPLYKDVQAQPSKDHLVFNVPLKQEVLLEETNNLVERIFLNTDAIKEDKDANSCGEETDTVNSDISNKRNIKKKFFICDRCDKLLNNKTALLRHIKDCISSKKFSFNCSHCNFKSNQKEGLSRHINAKHTKRELFSCSYCSFTTYRKQNVSRHVNAMHTKSNVFNCSYCDFKTYRNSHLNAHINSKHTKTISFDCTHCSYKAYEKRNLMAHINAKHTQKSLYHCPSCVYQTFYKSVLYRHVKDKHSEKISIPSS